MITLGGSPITLMLDKDVTYLDSILYVKDRIQVLPAAELRKIPYDDLRLWCHKNGVYGLPSTELIDMIKAEIGDVTKAIEVGAGNGVFGRALGIISTDSMIQNTPEMVALYKKIGSPIVSYGLDVLNMEATRAIKDLKPRVVFGSWVTQHISTDYDGPNKQGSIYGLKEVEFMQHLDKYIVYGNDHIHGDKDILKVPGLKITKHRNVDTFFSKATDHTANALWVIEQEHS